MVGHLLIIHKALGWRSGLVFYFSHFLKKNCTWVFIVIVLFPTAPLKIFNLLLSFFCVVCGSRHLCVCSWKQRSASSVVFRHSPLFRKITCLCICYCWCVHTGVCTRVACWGACVGMRGQLAGISSLLHAGPQAWQQASLLAEPCFWSSTIFAFNFYLKQDLLLNLAGPHIG